MQTAASIEQISTGIQAVGRGFDANHLAIEFTQFEEPGP